MSADHNVHEAYPGELFMFRGLVGVLRVVAKHGDMAEVQRLLAEHASDEQAAYAAQDAPPSTDAPRVLCAHGYVLLQDSCPGCDAAGEIPHAADSISVYSRWAKTQVRQCRTCGLSPSEAIHAAVSRG